MADNEQRMEMLREAAAWLLDDSYTKAPPYDDGTRWGSLVCATYQDAVCLADLLMALPEIDGTSLHVSRRDMPARVIVRCGRRRLSLHAIEQEWRGVSLGYVAKRWVDQAAYGRTKADADAAHHLALNDEEHAAFRARREGQL